MDGGEPSLAAERTDPAVEQLAKAQAQTPVAPRAERRAVPHTGAGSGTQERISLTTLQNDGANRQRNGWSARTQPIEVGTRPQNPGVGPVANLDPGYRNEPRRTRTVDPASPRPGPTVEPTKREVVDRILPSVDPRPAPQPEVRVTPKTVEPKTVIQTGGTPYTVRPGDSLERIARHELGDGTRWKEIQALNGISDPSKIVVGAVLRMPGGVPYTNQPASQPTTGRKVQPVVPSGAGTYTVQPGEVLSVIAQRELGSAQRMQDIVALNPGLNPDRVRVGQVLRMPKAGERVAASGTKSSPGKTRTAAKAPAKKKADDSRYVVQ